MKLILHIGHGKTGSTAFQEFLRKNIPELKQAGFDYAGPWFNHVLNDSPLKGNADILKPQKLAAAFNRYETECCEIQQRALIWSNEALSMDDKTGQVAEAIAEYVRGSKILSEIEIHIVLRRQSEWIESAYKQWGLNLKMFEGRKEPLSPMSFALSVHEWMNYHGLVRRWSENCSESIFIHTYDEVKSFGSSVPFFVSKLALPATLVDDSSRENVSLSPSVASLIGLYNAGFSKPFFPNDFIRLLQEANVKGLDNEGNTCFFSQEEKLLIEERYEPTNNLLALEYLGRDNLFPIESVRESNVYEHNCLSFITHLSVLLSHLNNRLKQGEKLLGKQQNSIIENYESQEKKLVSILEKYESQEKKLGSIREESEFLSKQLSSMRSERDSAVRRVDELVHSRSWRLTYPLRYLAKNTRRLTR